MKKNLDIPTSPPDDPAELTTEQEGTWRCQQCGEEAETVYFVDGRKLCESCRDRERRQRAEGARTP